MGPLLPLVSPVSNGVLFFVVFTVSAMPSALRSGGRMFKRVDLLKADFAQVTPAGTRLDSYRTREYCAFGCTHEEASGGETCRAFSWDRTSAECLMGSPATACAKVLSKGELAHRASADVSSVYLSEDSYVTKTLRIVTAINEDDPMTIAQHTLNSSTQLPAPCAGVDLVQMPDIEGTHDGSNHMTKFDGGMLRCYGFGSVKTSCSTWHPGQSAWVPTHDTNYPHRLYATYAMVALDDRTTLIAGDHDGDNAVEADSESSVEILEAGSSGWRVVSPLPESNYAMTLVATDSNTVYTIGGIKNKVFKYHKVTDTWEDKGAIPWVSSSGFFVYAPCGVVIRQGKRVIVCLGAQLMTKIIYYDMAADSWHDTGVAATDTGAAHACTKAFVVDNRIWRLGGKECIAFAAATTAVVVYNPDGDVVEEVSEPLSDPVIFPMEILEVRVVVAK